MPLLTAAIATPSWSGYMGSLCMPTTLRANGHLLLCRRSALVCVALALSAALGCRSKPGTRLRDETVPAACAMCIFKMEGVRACLWAVEIQNQYYLAEGKLPKQHDAHGPEGMCTMEREAVVDGELIHGKFVATRFDLKPAVHVPGQAARAPTHEH